MAEWKKECYAAYAAEQHGEKSGDAVDQPFGGAVEAIPMEDSLPKGPNLMMGSLAGYLNNIAAAVTNND